MLLIAKTNVIAKKIEELRQALSTAEMERTVLKKTAEIEQERLKDTIRTLIDEKNASSPESFLFRQGKRLMCIIGRTRTSGISHEECRGSQDGLAAHKVPTRRRNGTDDGVQGRCIYLNGFETEKAAGSIGECPTRAEYVA